MSISTGWANSPSGTNIACLRLRGKDERPGTYRGKSPLLVLGIIGCVAGLKYIH